MVMFVHVHVLNDFISPPLSLLDHCSSVLFSFWFYFISFFRLLSLIILKAHCFFLPVCFAGPRDKHRIKPIFFLQIYFSEFFFVSQIIGS